MGNQIRPRSNSTSPVPSTSDEPSAKRARLLEIVTPTTSGTIKTTSWTQTILTWCLLGPDGSNRYPLLALEYGADLVWGPEIVDKAIIGSTRIVDETSGTIQYTKNNGTSSIWQTHPIEKSRLIYQIGSANKELALSAAQTVADDVSGIDLNCGCPKDFSLKGGMGAALLKEPDKLCGILIHLVQNLPTHPISVKIRLLPSQEETLSLVKKICETGVSCLTVHCRTQPMRSTEPALLHRLREIVDFVNQIRTSDNPLPVVANGDCYTLQDLPKFKELTGVTRVMIARGAESNVSCFRSDGLLNTIEEIMPRYIKAGLITRQGYPNAKYCLSTMDVKNEPKSGPNKNKFSRKELKTKIQQCPETGPSNQPELSRRTPNLGGRIMLALKFKVTLFLNGRHGHSFYSSACQDDTLSRYLLKRKPSTDSLRERLESLADASNPKRGKQKSSKTPDKHRSPRLVRVRRILQSKPKQLKEEEDELKRLTGERMYWYRQQENARRAEAGRLALTASPDLNNPYPTCYRPAASAPSK
ncbi:hypothetical protein H4Q26_000554 [Puccinia striiformis f. sp. tritici PST-130]|nr:hypothetical protein H4Q26_000554 [Puccinia striiformis f. sp. tritici PST-130]